jgi:hypothetical protein
MTLVERGDLVSVGKGIGLSCPTQTNDERQKAPLLVSGDQPGLKGSFSLRDEYQPGLKGFPENKKTVAAGALHAPAPPPPRW